MDQGTETDTIASFTGKLLRCEPTLDQKFVQLVFHEDNRDVLCVSTSRRAAELPIGRSYHVEGPLKQHGEQGFIYNSKVTLNKKRGLPLRRFAFVLVVVISVVGFGGMTYMQHDVAKKSPTTPTVAQLTQPTVATKTTPAQTIPTTAVTPSSTTAPTTTPATTKQTSTTTKTTAKPTSTPTSSPVASTTPSAPTTPATVAAIPSTPTDVTATVTGDAINPDSVTITWSASTDTGNPGLGGYYVFQDGNPDPIADVTGGATSLVDDSPASGSTYTYTVEAYDATTTSDVSAMSDVATVTAP